MTGLVFISYAREDRDYVEKLVLHLTGAGVEVSWDFQIQAGATYAREIEKRIDTCSAVLFVVTPESYESEWARRELHHALEQRKPILPVLLKTSPMPIQINDRQGEDVRGGSMPSTAFVAALGGNSGGDESAWSESDLRRIVDDERPACHRMVRILDRLAERPGRPTSLTELATLTDFTRGQLGGAFNGFTRICRLWWPDHPKQGIWPIRSHYRAAPPGSGRTSEMYYTLSAGNAQRWRRVRQL
ncbi:toll/interleukin-1 receptor domain-containing protein [Cryptosporangium japonicum]|uniref:toll/interleukin-1 receptor domain-containing protein n=1 Tax=Cryptosporangium japonicum TaxID=80872 RepID=UPI0031DD2619